MTTSRRSEDIQKLRKDLKQLVEDGETLLKAEGDELMARGEELHARLKSTLDAAKSMGRDWETSARRELENVDLKLHENPYQFAGLACAIGVLVGLYLNRR